MSEFNDSVAFGNRVLRGGSWNGSDYEQRSPVGSVLDPKIESDSMGFRVASVPEPSTIVLLMLGGAACLWRGSVF